MNRDDGTIHYVRVFFWLIILLILLSLGVRFFNLIYNSSFKSNSFSILYLSNNSKIISVDETSRTVSYISIGNINEIVKGKNPFIASVALGVPINGILTDENRNLDPEFQDFISFGNEARLILSFGTDFKSFNEYDLHKILSIARSAEKKDIKISKVDLINDEYIDKKLEGMFFDKTIADSDYTVEIVNGTDVNGLANSVASMLSKKGFNIIFLQSINGKFDENSYLGFEFEKNSFVESLQRLTKFESKSKTISTTADITLYLGKDLESQFSK